MSDTSHEKITLATYTDPIIPAYRGNPLIEALPGIFTAGEVLRKLTVMPEIVPNYQSLPVEVRLHLIFNLNQFFQPNRYHVDLEQKISRAIRAGYIARNPIYIQYWQGVVELFNKKIDLKNAPEEFLLLEAKQNSFALLGVTGTGKTTSLKKILKMYQQVIYHQHYNGKKLFLTQITYLLVECPSDGSLRGLCFNILHAIDNLIGSRHYAIFSRNGKATKDEMKISIKNLTRLYGIGLIGIDEAGNLADAKSNDQNDVLNFLIELDNFLGVPVILIGTPKAIPLLQHELQVARRESGQGDSIWDRMKKDSDIWKTFIRELSKYQYLPVTNKIVGNEVLEDALYDTTQGIADFVVKVFLFAQIRAAITGMESLTPDLIRSVAADSLQLAKPTLDALRSNDFEKLQKMSDVNVMSLEEFYQKSVQENYSLVSLSDSETSEESKSINMSGPIMAAPGKSSDSTESSITKQALNKKKKSRKLKTEESTYSEGDLRLVMGKAAKEKMDPHSALGAAEYLFSVSIAIPVVEKK